MSPEDTQSAIKTLVDVVQTANPGTCPSRTITWLDTKIPTKFIWQPDEGKGNLSFSRAQLQALKCEGHLDADDRLVSRAYVYDIRRYTESSLYGPFIQDEKKAWSINYIHLRHLINIQFNNLHESHGDEENDGTFISKGFNSTRAMSAPASSVEGDWAGVEGEWIRFVCWMGYVHLEGAFPYFLYHFTAILIGSIRLQRESSLTYTKQPNLLTLVEKWPGGEVPDPDDELDTTIFSEEGFMENHAFLFVTMHVTSIDPPSLSSPHLRPKIHFSGTTMGGGLNEARVKGFVEDEGEGVIRWHLFSFSGNMRKWQSEGVQLGGVQSAAVSIISCLLDVD